MKLYRMLFIFYNLVKGYVTLLYMYLLFYIVEFGSFYLYNLAKSDALLVNLVGISSSLVHISFVLAVN